MAILNRFEFAKNRGRDTKGRFIVPETPSVFDKAQYKKEYRKTHSKELVEKAIEWGRNNKDKRKAIKKRWSSKNKELINFYSKRRNYLRKNAVGFYTKEEIDSLFKKYNSLCAYCVNSKATSIDHVIPLSKGGTNFVENLLPACIPCNSRKKDKIYAKV